MSKNMEDLIYFLKTASKEYIDIFMDMYKTLTPNLLNEAILRVTATNSKRLPNPNRIRRLYETNYQMIGKRIEEYLSTGRKI